jgi:hypothetical protein
MSDMFSECSTVFRFYWWNFAFTFATLLSIAIAACTRLGLHYSRAFWVGMLTTCLFMNMVACEAFLGYEKVRAEQQLQTLMLHCSTQFPAAPLKRCICQHQYSVLSGTHSSNIMLTVKSDVQIMRTYQSDSLNAKSTAQGELVF